MAGRLTLRHLLACTIAGAVLSKENAFSLVVYCNFKNVMYISKQGIFFSPPLFFGLSFSCQSQVVSVKWVCGARMLMQGRNLPEFSESFLVRMWVAVTVHCNKHENNVLEKRLHSTSNNCIKFHGKNSFLGQFVSHHTQKKKYMQVNSRKNTFICVLSKFSSFSLQLTKSESRRFIPKWINSSYFAFGYHTSRSEKARAKKNPRQTQMCYYYCDHHDMIIPVLLLHSLSPSST